MQADAAPTWGWMLSSGCGRESASWVVRSIDRSKDGSTLVCDVTLAGIYYAAVLDSRAAEPDFRLALHGLKLWTRELERLVDSLEAWLALPLPELARVPIALECSMGGLFDQSLRFELGARDDTLAGGKPVATLRYIVGRMTGQMWFPIDSGCLRGFADGITATLRWGGDVP